MKRLQLPCMQSEDLAIQNFSDFKISDQDEKEQKSMTIFDAKFEILLFDRGEI